MPPATWLLGWLIGPSKKPTVVPFWLIGVYSAALVTSALSAGVWPAVVSNENLVARFALRSAELSTTEMPTSVRIERSVPTGARNQKLSVNPSPSVSVNVREMMLRAVPPLNSSVGLPRSFRRKKFGSATLGSLYAVE